VNLSEEFGDRACSILVDGKRRGWPVTHNSVLVQRISSAVGPEKKGGPAEQTPLATMDPQAAMYIPPIGPNGRPQ